jgi:hypothetical protein
MTRQVDTRNGLFANEGWGGGVFNYNVAFGSVDATPRHFSSLGATVVEEDFCSNLDPARSQLCLADLDTRPWMEFSDTTLAQQQVMNASLGRLRKCPLLEDGRLGLRSCGAMDLLSAAGEGHFSFTCEAHRAEGFIAPRDPPCELAPSPPPPDEPQPLPPAPLPPAPLPEPEPEPLPTPSPAKTGTAGILMLSGVLLVMAGTIAVLGRKKGR